MTNPTAQETVFTFPTSRQAWSFHRSIGQGVGARAGYPSLSAPYTVRTILDCVDHGELAEEAKRFGGAS
jgi:hypothetical protein